MPKTKLPRETRTCIRDGCSVTFEVNPRSKSEGAKRACSRSCARIIDNAARSLAKQDAWYLSEDSLCPCGERIPYEKRATRLYCSDACTAAYGKKRQADPANYVTFDCETCGTETTRYKNYGNGATRFCSKECAAKWTRKVRHIGIKDSDVVLDSGYEARVWGAATYHKVPIARVDRSEAVPVGEGWYAPDFIVNGHYVEVKGYERPDDQAKWDAWNEAHPASTLIVLRREDLADDSWLSGIAAVTKA